MDSLNRCLLSVYYVLNPLQDVREGERAVQSPAMCCVLRETRLSQGNEISQHLIL